MNADVESFQVLSRFFSKDKNQLYFMAYAAKKGEVDLETFYTKKDDALHYIGFDKNHVYAFEKIYSTEKVFAKLQIIENANPKTYVGFDNSFAKDDKNHFYENQIIKVDYNSFENISRYFSRDKDSVYYHYYPSYFESLMSADLNSFEISNSEYITFDEKKVFFLYFEDDTIEMLSIERNKGEEVILLDYPFLQIGKQVYFGASPLDLDSNTIQILRSDYSKDENKVYYKDQLLDDADAASFGPIGLSKDQIGDKIGPFKGAKRVAK